MKHNMILWGALSVIFAIMCSAVCCDFLDCPPVASSVTAGAVGTTVGLSFAIAIMINQKKGISLRTMLLAMLLVGLWIVIWFVMTGQQLRAEVT
jgi:hypothetical protein